MKIRELHETKKERNLLGLKFFDMRTDTMDERVITKSTPDEKWDGDLDVSLNSLVSLRYSPKEVAGSFNCSNNKLTSLEFGPQQVGGDYRCHENRTLTSLKGAPAVMSSKDGVIFECSDTPMLTSLEGAPSRCAILSCNRSGIKSLEGAPRWTDEIRVNSTRITSFHDVHRMIAATAVIRCANVKIEECVLVLLLVKGLISLDVGNSRSAVALKRTEDFIAVADIINRYLPNVDGRSTVLTCQNELLDAGFEEFARM